MREIFGIKLGSRTENLDPRRRRTGKNCETEIKTAILQKKGEIVNIYGEYVYKSRLIELPISIDYGTLHIHY